MCVCLPALPNVLCMLPMAVARSFSGGVTKSQGKDNFKFFFLNDNALYSIAFETPAKTAEPMPFGLITRVGHSYHALDGGPDPSMRRDNFGGKRSGPL